jgi:hypothetical protein
LRGCKLLFVSPPQPLSSSLFLLLLHFFFFFFFSGDLILFLYWPHSDEQVSTMRHANSIIQAGGTSRIVSQSPSFDRLCISFSENWRRRNRFMLFLYQYGFRKLLSSGEVGDSPDLVSASFVAGDVVVQSHPIFDNQDLCRLVVLYL